MKKIRLIYILPFLFSCGMSASDSVVFSTKNPPNQSSLPSGIRIAPNGFMLSVFESGKVTGQFTVKNNNRIYKYLLFPQIVLYSKVNRKNRLFESKQSDIPSKVVLTNSTGIFNYEFSIGKEQAKKVKSFYIIIPGQGFHVENHWMHGVADWAKDKKKTIGLTAATVVALLLLGSFLLTRKPKKRKSSLLH